MAAYVAGEAGAIRELFERYGPVLGRMGRRHGLSDSDAEDLVQQTFLLLHRARRDFRPGARLRPWLFTIANNVRREFFRRAMRKPEVSLEEPDRVTEPRGMGDRQVAAHDVAKGLAALTDDQREVIVLHWFEGLSFPEISSVVGASVSAVKVRAHRGYEVLRRRMGGAP